MKKLISVSLSLLLLSFILAACSDIGNEATTADSESAAATPETTLVFSENEENTEEANATEENISLQANAPAAETTEAEAE